MSNKEKLAEEYAKDQYCNYNYPNKQGMIDGTEMDFIAGYEAAEQEMMRFSEWTQRNRWYMITGSGSPDHEGKWVLYGKVCDTTQQLLAMFRKEEEETKTTG